MFTVIVWVVFGSLALWMLRVGLTQRAEQKQLLANARGLQVQITRSEVVASTPGQNDRGSYPSNRTTTYRPNVEFRYEVNGVPFTSDRIYPTIIPPALSSRERAAEILKDFPAGATVDAFVDVRRPDRAFLIAEAGVGPLVFIVIGLLLPPTAWVIGQLVTSPL